MSFFFILCEVERKFEIWEIEIGKRTGVEYLKLILWEWIGTWKCLHNMIILYVKEGKNFCKISQKPWWSISISISFCYFSYTFNIELMEKNAISENRLLIFRRYYRSRILTQSHFIHRFWIKLSSICWWWTLYVDSYLNENL